MGLYERHVLPRVIDLTCGSHLVQPLRTRVCAGLSGDVVEIGFGSGLNVAEYPSTVRHVAAVDPSDGGWGLAEDRVATSPVPIERAGLDGERLPFADGTFDAALSTFTLCTVPDARAALSEIRRVLRPGGTLHFLEHGRAPDESVRRWQHRLEPIQRRVAGGCHLTRDIVGLVTDAELTVGDVDRFYQSGTPKFFGAISLGVAVATS
ncbi:class I SAM-dependent methyltransferase [Gordonia soli]|uniref:Putative methyltransferase n=1 Tax=Gordonia soli NBRC 108243 TaxID=1223545 RepID=M0QKK8_9ACTN|nr:class I SAM-dependent methyltransferase [Gordonia soli]GAC67952.1 putative methyltransferase [Gordonia soli NBRC 108243]